jgi:hypothetical protein
MAGQKDRPTFLNEGNRAFITVEAAKAEALRHYLQNKGIRTDSPGEEKGDSAILFGSKVAEASFRIFPILHLRICTALPILRAWAQLPTRPCRRPICRAGSTSAA